eukprot:3369579-Rhodomonas_salina.1
MIPRMSEELLRSSNNVKAILVVYDVGDLDSHVSNGRNGAINQYNRICGSLGVADPVTFRPVNRAPYDLVVNLERALPSDSEQVPEEELTRIREQNERDHNNFTEAYISHVMPAQATITLAATP